VDEARADDASRLTSPAYSVENLTRGLTLAAHVRVAQTSAERRRGLLGVEELSDSAGLWIHPCEAIHTFGMKMPLDALFLTRDYKVRKILSNLPPRRIGFCLPAHSVLELRAGTIARTGTQPGDQLQFHLRFLNNLQP
jgi:uncharacterized membrane protein (UPF0127 family)